MVPTALLDEMEQACRSAKVTKKLFVLRMLEEKLETARRVRAISQGGQ